MNAAQRTILYVEDDTLTRETVARRLRKTGFTVLEAGSAEEALTACQPDTSVDVLLLEPALRGSCGIDLQRTLRRSRPGLPVVICTAAVNDVPPNVLETEHLASGCYCSKPCSFSELVTCIRCALASAEEDAASRPT